MISVLSPSSTLPLDIHGSKLHFDELETLDNAVDSFTKMLSHSGKTAVRLHCTVPMWSPSYDTNLDLHDVNELRSRVLHFVHDLLQSLRAVDITASYSLIPSSSPVCFVWALPPNLRGPLSQFNIDELPKSAQMGRRDKIFLADSNSAPCLIIT
ncbi:hypothetical protein APHAL10511_006379 [Amanita phalloides]|nr:hypothetical protein APHAL10511_006379 [Amanita phalloides]